MGSTEPVFDVGCSLWFAAVMCLLVALFAPVRRLCLSWAADVPYEQQLILTDNRETLTLLGAS